MIEGLLVVAVRKLAEEDEQELQQIFAAAELPVKWSRGQPTMASGSVETYKVRKREVCRE